MKANLNFDLDELDDRLAHTRCVKSLELVLVLSDLDEWLRRKIKYENDAGGELAGVPLVWSEMRTMLQNKLEEHGINLEDMIR